VTTVFTPMARTLPSHRLDLATHERTHGISPLAAFSGAEGRRRFVAEVGAADLRGRGGAGFPTARKLAAVQGRRAVVVANGCEGDPLSHKDNTLLTLAPHLVLDGVQLAAQAVAATEAVLCVHRGSTAIASVLAALAERRDPVPVRVAEIPPRYVASEESALVNYLTTGDARPTGKEPRPAERGVGGRPTLVDNVDTLAQLALVARAGADAYRRSRTDLVTVSGAVRSPGVVEVQARRRVRRNLAALGRHGHAPGRGARDRVGARAPGFGLWTGLHHEDAGPARRRVRPAVWPVHVRAACHRRGLRRTPTRRRGRRRAPGPAAAAGDRARDVRPSGWRGPAGRRRAGGVP